MEDENKPSRRTWDLMIGIALVIFGSLRLYNRLQANIEWDFRAIFTILFIGYGVFLIYRHFQNSKKN
ncbi:hypothetical protein [Aquimarina mytili]|uniref:Uncharacterized protein n=1 Tax=Aquimarina mytili TaxID=874423 RepID=A0A937A6Y7_9FLAO|nr:hypothetical protein [Aquimarina mytili]MBL0686000.1 hypothetical protein [Aquimarina mytili]